MKTFIVTYDLNNPGKNYTDLIAKIKAYGTWAKLGGSSYLLNSDKKASEIRDDLKQNLDSNDKLFVSVCPPPSAWTGLDSEVAKWILDNQQ